MNGKGLFAIVDCFTGGIGEAAKRERYVVRDPTDIPSLMDTIRTVLNVKAQRVVIDPSGKLMRSFLEESLSQIPFS